MKPSKVIYVVDDGIDESEYLRNPDMVQYEKFMKVSEFTKGTAVLAIGRFSTEEPCQIDESLLEEIAKQFDGRLMVGKIDCGYKFENLHARFLSETDINKIPATLFYKDGERIDYIKYGNMVGKEHFLHLIERHLGIK